MSLSPKEQEGGVYNILWRQSRDEFLVMFGMKEDPTSPVSFSTDDLESVRERTEVRYIDLVERGFIINEFMPEI